MTWHEKFFSGASTAPGCSWGTGTEPYFRQSCVALNGIQCRIEPKHSQFLTHSAGEAAAVAHKSDTPVTRATRADCAEHSQAALLSFSRAEIIRQKKGPERFGVRKAFRLHDFPFYAEPLLGQAKRLQMTLQASQGVA